MGDFSEEERDDFARQDGVLQHRQRRSPPRLPATTLRPQGDDARGCIPLTEAAFLTERDKAVFRLINGEVFNVIRCGMVENFPVPEDFLQALDRAARALFQCDPDDALWIVPFLVELELGRSERLLLETNDTDPGKVSLLPLAERVLERARRSIQRLAPFVDLPRWLSPRLTALFLKRFSFAGGGGPHAALTRDSVRRLLAKPIELADYLRESPERVCHLAEELAILDAAIVEQPVKQARANRARPDLIDYEHASERERRGAREARKATRASLTANVASSRIVCTERGFVGVRFDARSG